MDYLVESTKQSVMIYYVQTIKKLAFASVLIFYIYLYSSLFSVGETIVPPEECFYGDVRLVGDISTIFEEYIEIRGTAEVCVNGVFRSICNSDTVQLGHLPSLSRVMCSQLGYNGHPPV